MSDGGEGGIREAGEGLAVASDIQSLSGKVAPAVYHEMLHDPEWGKVAGWPYFVTRDGRVRGLRRRAELRPTPNHNGYLILSLRRHDGGTRMASVHRLVVEVWRGPIPAGMQINHKDGNKRNNHIDNLEVVTREENLRHAIDMGLIETKLTTDQALAIRDSVGSLSQVAGRYGINGTTVHAIRHGRLWKHLGPRQQP